MSGDVVTGINLYIRTCSVHDGNGSASDCFDDLSNWSCRATDPSSSAPGPALDTQFDLVMANDLAHSSIENGVFPV